MSKLFIQDNLEELSYLNSYTTASNKDTGEEYNVIDQLSKPLFPLTYFLTKQKFLDMD